jgi:hypothetical protein
MILDTINKSIRISLGRAHATEALEWVSDWADHTTTTLVPGATHGASNGAIPVVVVAAPGESTQRQVRFLNVYNSDTIAQVVTVDLIDGATVRRLKRATLAAGDSLTYTSEVGWTVTDVYGNVRTVATPGGSGVGTGDNVSLHGHAGGGGWEIWHVPMMAANTALSTAAITANRLYAEMFVAPRRGGTLDRIAVNVTTGVAGAMRLGLYLASSESNIYPGALALDAGTVDVTSTGVKPITINQPLIGGATYWAVCISGVAPTIRGMAIAGCSGALGISSALGTAPNTGLYAAYTYGVLPAVFPGGATILVAAPIPAIALRFSA